ncbi:MAG: hypothetical protein OZ948_15195 [Deltaproteobacteria bacterium]|nr:hypothetical protein [Deltaproteobacteria bacterium]
MIRTPPKYCQYAGGACDQAFEGIKPSVGIFLYPSEPQQIAAAIESAAEDLELSRGGNWLTWRKFAIAGQVIFCAICKRMRFADFVAADVTTLNFNLLFEIGFGIGLGLPVIPIRDASYLRDKDAFNDLGLLDTLGYTDFRNAEDLVQKIGELRPEPLPPLVSSSPDSALYVLRSRHETEGEVVLASILRRSFLEFRTFDADETPRLSLHEARKQVATSVGVIAHLLDAAREGATVHNARCALVAGLAMSQGKTVVLLQEGERVQPIDYRDVVSWYSRPDQIERLIEKPLRQVMQRFFDRSLTTVESPRGLLQKLDIGDVAAENEVRPLQSYFVPTGQYEEAKRGHARLVVGRKGSGKTAIFYALNAAFESRTSHVVLALKPEGHQLSRLRESVLEQLTPGVREYLLTAFWNSILLAELARKITEDEISWAHRDEARRRPYERVALLHEQFGMAEEGDFSQRLLHQINRVIAVFSTRDSVEVGEITEHLFRVDLRELTDAVGDFLSLKEETWMLVDNLDKGWPTLGVTAIDILIVRTLLEATRKLQRQLDRKGVDFRAMVFLRNDVYEHLVDQTPDRGKETAIVLDWDDREVLKEMVRRRIIATTGLDGTFDAIWGALFESTIGAQQSFHYMVDRTLMRPRDLLMFIRRAIEVATNRGHEKVTAEDIRHAEESYSNDMLQSVTFELRDVQAGSTDWVYAFLDSEVRISQRQVQERIRPLCGEADVDRAIELLVWFGFLGVARGRMEDSRYAFDVRYDMKKLLAPLTREAGFFVIHPAFRRALECRM